MRFSNLETFFYQVFNPLIDLYHLIEQQIDHLPLNFDLHVTFAAQNRNNFALYTVRTKKRKTSSRTVQFQTPGEGFRMKRLFLDDDSEGSLTRTVGK